MQRRQVIKSLTALGLGATIAAPVLADGHTTVVSQGSFEGRSNHVTTGTAYIIQEDGRYFVELGDDFSLDRGPDPRVGFGRNGQYDPESYLGALLSLTGKQRYAVPVTWDPSEFSDVFIWCELASVPLGVAALN